MKQNSTAIPGCSECPKSITALKANLQDAGTCSASTYKNEYCNEDNIINKLADLKTGKVTFTPNYCSQLASKEGGIGFVLGIADFVSGGLASTIANSKGGKDYTCYTQALSLYQCQVQSKFQNCQKILESCLANIQKEELQDQFTQVQENLEYANDLLNYKINYVYSLTIFGILFTFLLFVYILSE